MIVAALLLLRFITAVEAKSIRLRNELIDPSSDAGRAAMTAMTHTKAPVSGLFLVQFTGSLEPATRAELLGTGVDLIRYIPDNAFIARFNNVSPARVAAIKSVAWIGPLRPADKVHPRLASVAAGKAALTNRMVEVNLMLTATATAGEIAAARGLLANQDATHLRQGIILRGALPVARIAELAQSPAVLWIEPAPTRRLFDEHASKIVGGNDGNLATPTLTQQMGFTGTNVTVCVADTGLDTGDTNTLHPDLFGRVTGFQFYGSLTNGADNYGHGTHIAGIIAGNAATGEIDTNSGARFGLGIAPQASVFVERIFDESGAPVSPAPSDETLTHDAVRHGALIGANSWGNDVHGDYDIDAAQFDELVRDADAGTAGDQPYILEFSVGNTGAGGAQTVASPASAKNVITTGASQNITNAPALARAYCIDGPDAMAPFSSQGPCADGRLKPDLVAPGSWIASAASSLAPSGATAAWAPIDSYYVYLGGTSMSGPLAAGAAAVFVQFYRAIHTNAVPSPALVKAALINSADELDRAKGGPGAAPNNLEGWGRVDLRNIVSTNPIALPRYYQFLDQTALLTNGALYTQHLFVQAADQPLKITLAYTDEPGFPGANPALVNDLDLELVAPDGTLYRGNQFNNGESVSNAATADHLNNVEGIYLSHPLPGDYTVRVRGSQVVQDARVDTPAIDQDFALVSSGDTERPGTGFILLDRSVYTAPDEMELTVFAASVAGSNSVNAYVTNLTTHSSTAVQLSAAGDYGVFTGTVATVTDPASAGQIQIADADQLAAAYRDPTGVTRTVNAVADLSGPVIAGLTVTNDAGLLALAWQSSEPATSIVYYGTNSLNLSLAATNLTLATNHLTKLSSLSAGATYYFYIVSRDAVGNATTNDNGGVFYTFTGIATPMVLLVDAYDTAAESTNGSTVIPDGAYTNLLDAAGISYGFWKVNARGYPLLSDLQPFPIVLWRLTDDAVNYRAGGANNTINPPQQAAIQAYLNGGGSFLLASMGVLSRLGDVAFRHTVLQVDAFKLNPYPPAPCLKCDEDFGVPSFLGSAFLSANTNVSLDYSRYPVLTLGLNTYGPDFSDTFTPSSNAVAVAFQTASGKPCGMCYPRPGVASAGRTVFLAFPLDSAPTNDAVKLLQGALAFLAPGANDRGSVWLDNVVYTTNAIVTVEVGDSGLAGVEHATVNFSTSSNTNVVALMLAETSRPGFFHGTLTLVNGPAATNQITVQDGDLLTATYLDASNSSNIVATATIDALAPAISGVTCVPSYSTARINWSTTEAANATAQYGLTTPNRSVNANGWQTNHALILTGLTANTTYYYQVASRDPAGNVAVDDNHGSFYTFQTLPALAAPWFDNLESGATNWNVVADPDNGSDLNWTLGTPSNLLASAANSGTNAWSSDLAGIQSFVSANSYLYTPAIDLAGLKSATLTFSNIFDFSHVDPFSGRFLEDGSVYVSTNGGPLVLLADYTNATAISWQPETVDLTPFTNRVIQIAFYYRALSLGYPVYGWTLDDVAVRGVIAGGDITISKNLGQGTWTLCSLGANGLTPIQSDVAPAV
ncbi:MAG TPA: S8 family serine peptidase, partial [Verrucomicrobiae bacterium]